MVNYRPDPRGMDTAELMRWQPTLGMFRKVSYGYLKYRLIEQSLRNAGLFFFLGSLVACPVIAFVCCYRMEKGTSKLSTQSMKHAERPFEYFDWARDLKKIRGEWNNNFLCWSDDPDCGKDYKIKYSA